MILMFTGNSQNLPLLKTLSEKGKPVVLLERLPSDDREFDWVGVDNVISARQIVEHLIGMGHRSIAHVTTYEKVSSVQDRLKGYCQALKAAGLPNRPELIVPHGNDQRGITVPIATLRALFDLPDPPTAIFAIHDWAAFLTMVSLHLMGIRVPEEVVVAGFDGIERYRQDRPLLTTAEIPFERMGRQAARLVLDRLQNRRWNSVRHVSLEAPLRARFSTLVEEGDSLLYESSWRGRLIYHYMLENLTQPLTIEHLASIAGVSPSTLFQDFQRIGDQSPMHSLLSLRLEQIHWELCHPCPDTTVSGCAIKFGIHHLGRLATAYREKYGETPSVTLRRSLESLEKKATEYSE
jgi:AraC-like DNA-binding protein